MDGSANVAKFTVTLATRVDVLPWTSSLGISTRSTYLGSRSAELRFTVHRPPNGEVSLCWYRPSGGDVAGGVDVGVAWLGFAGDAGENRLALAVFGCDVPAGGASLRRVRGRDPFESSRGFVVEPGNQRTPPLTHHCAVEAPLLRDANTGLINGAACGAGHRPYVERFDSDCVEPARKVGGGLFDPIASPICFARFYFRDSELGALSAVRAGFGAREASLQAVQAGPRTRCEARSVQQLSGGQRRRYHHTSVDTDHAVIGRSGNGVGNVREADMPAPGAIPSDAVRLHTCGYGSGAAEADASDLRHPYSRVTAVDFLDTARYGSDLPEAFMHASFAPRRTPVGAGKKVPHGLCEVPQRLLLHCLRPGRQPVVCGARRSQLCRLLVVPGSMTARPPEQLLLYGQVPDEPGMPAMLRKHHLLSRRRQQAKPRHTRKLATATDINRARIMAHRTIGAPSRYKRGSFRPKEKR
jgi:hypothetical protein